MLKLLIPAALILGGCSTKSEESYYKAVESNNAKYMKAYSGAKQGGFSFDGTFNGKMEFTEARIAPKLQSIQQPKTVMDYTLEAAGIVLPSAVAVAGFHYNYKSNKVNANANRDIAISGNETDAVMFESFGSNFKNDSTTSTSLSDTSVSDTSITDTSTSTDTDSTSVTNTSTQTIPPLDTTDGTNVIGIN